MSELTSHPRLKPQSFSNYFVWSGEIRAWLMKLEIWMLVKRVELEPSNIDSNTLTAAEAAATWLGRLRLARLLVSSIWLWKEPKEHIFLA